MSLVGGAHIKYELVYHVQWYTKYRYRIFGRDEVRCDYENALTTVASWHGIQLIEFAVVPEHVYAIVSVPSTMSLQELFQYLKGGSSFQFFRLHPEYRMRYPKGHLFSPGKFCRSVGPVDMEREINYVRNQSRHYAIDPRQRRL